MIIGHRFLRHVDKMLAETRMKLKNAESSIAFLQSQHAEILQGLHSEIQTLQQKCARKLQLFWFVSQRVFVCDHYSRNSCNSETFFVVIRSHI